jgi:hypothetical protein
MARVRPPVRAAIAEELAEGVWPRAKRDAKKVGTGTFTGGVILAIGAGFGNHLAGEDHAPHRHPTELVELGLPILGVLAGALLILLGHLLLTFRVQRNEARTALGVAGTGKRRRVRREKEIIREYDDDDAESEVDEEGNDP